MRLPCRNYSFNEAVKLNNIGIYNILSHKYTQLLWKIFIFVISGTTPNQVIARLEVEVHYQIYKQYM